MKKKCQHEYCMLLSFDKVLCLQCKKEFKIKTLRMTDVNKI